MVKYGLARSRSHAFNILIEKGLNEVMRRVEFWEQIYIDVEGWKSRASRSLMMD